MTYMDDIEGGGSAKFVQAVMNKCKEKEIEKLWEFSAKKIQMDVPGQQEKED